MRPSERVSPNPWLNLLAEATSGALLVGIAVGVVLLYGATHLAKRPRLGGEVVGFEGDPSFPVRVRSPGDDRHRTEEIR